MKINGSFSFNKSERELLSDLNLEFGGKVQKYVDSAVIRHSEPYLPFRTGALARSVQTSTVIGSGEVVYNTPYAGRLYYNPPYNFDTTFHPQAGAYWFERMKADHKNDILEGAKKIAGSK